MADDRATRITLDDNLDADFHREAETDASRSPNYNTIAEGLLAQSDRPVLVSRLPQLTRLDNVSSEQIESNPSFSRLLIQHPENKRGTESDRQVCLGLLEAIALRSKYIHSYPDPWRDVPVCEDGSSKPPYDPFNAPPVAAAGYVIDFGDDGVFSVRRPSGEKLWDTLGVQEYYDDLATLARIVDDGETRSFCFHRMRIVEARFGLHVLLNSSEELAAQKIVPHRDFYNVRKVDTHIHHSSAMNHKHLLRFIKRKFKTEGDKPVIVRDGKVHTLNGVFASLNLTPYDLSVDHLDVHAHQAHDLMHRFDKFNLKYNPIGEARLREIFLKTDNYIGGTYLAELTHELFDDLALNKYQQAEYRISIYGKAHDEWDKLARWFVTNRIYSDHVRWLIQVPRLFDIYRKAKLVASFADFLANIFKPLFEVTADSSTHPELHLMLQQVVGFDCVDDESKMDLRVPTRPPTPAEWTFEKNPPFSYYQYHMWANITALNKFRAERGLNTFAYRPHVGEAGDTSHLDCGFLVANAINHGLTLKHSPAMLYLFYITQIGIAMSPLSNNSLFLSYSKSPFPEYFAKGLNVSLSTDDPLQFHITREPLIEEYSILSQVFKLSACDLCEVAMHSVRQSGFEHQVKVAWLGPQYLEPGHRGNSINKTNVPNIRLCFREEMLSIERALVASEGLVSTTFESGVLQRVLSTATPLEPPGTPGMSAIGRTLSTAGASALGEGPIDLLASGDFASTGDFTHSDFLSTSWAARPPGAAPAGAAPAARK
eukprot:a842310_27.p1 GENE.a842310_27~~a842310_27.p1  ORF type:complete len:776 (-),score=337.39 a842310_27:17-2320(-)